MFVFFVLAKMSVVLVLVFETNSSHMHNDKSPPIAKGNPNEPASYTHFLVFFVLSKTPTAASVVMMMHSSG